jgi:hypothetical protein
MSRPRARSRATRRTSAQDLAGVELPGVRTAPPLSRGAGTVRTALGVTDAGDPAPASVGSARRRDGQPAARSASARSAAGRYRRRARSARPPARPRHDEHRLALQQALVHDARSRVASMPGWTRRRWMRPVAARATARSRWWGEALRRPHRQVEGARQQREGSSLDVRRGPCGERSSRNSSPNGSGRLTPGGKALSAEERAGAEGRALARRQRSLGGSQRSSACAGVATEKLSPNWSATVSSLSSSAAPRQQRGRREDCWPRADREQHRLSPHPPEACSLEPLRAAGYSGGRAVSRRSTAAPLRAANSPRPSDQDAGEPGECRR